MPVEMPTVLTHSLILQLLPSVSLLFGLMARYLDERRVRELAGA